MLAGTILCILFLARNAFSLCGTTKACFQWQDREGTCEFSGYVPGGKKVILEPIESPHAFDQSSSLAQYAYFCDYGNTVVGSALDLTVFTTKVEKFAAKLSAALGVWGSIVGGFLYQEPTTANIIDGMNEAFDRLTEQINDQFYNMEEYVKQEILELEKKLMNNQYRSYVKQLNLCLEKLDRALFINCLIDAHDDSLKEQESFMSYRQQMETYWWGVFVAGDGISDKEIKLPDLYDSKQACFIACSKKMNEGYNGVTYGRGGGHEKECVCEINMVGVKTSDGSDEKWECAFIVGTGSFQDGDGIYLEQIKLPGLYETKQDCFRSCAEEKIRNSSYNGVTFGKVGKPNEKQCWCNVGMSGLRIQGGKYESAWLANLPSRRAKMCKCRGGDEYGDVCKDWDPDGIWCYVEDPDNCEHTTESGYYTGKYWSKEPCVDTYWLAIVDDVKYMEVEFLTFRNYAQLRMLMLMSIIATFDNTTDAEYPHAKEYYKIYLNHLREESDLYLRYANFVYDQILFMHNPGNNWVKSKLYCKDSWEESKWWQRTHCFCQFSPMLIDTDRCKETYNLFIQEWGFTHEGFCPCKDYDDREEFELIPPTHKVSEIDFDKTFPSYGVHRMYDENEENFVIYRDKATKSVVNFWNAEVISQLGVWKDILDGTLQKLEAVKSIDVMDLMYDQYKNKPAANDQQENEPDVYEEQKDEL